MVGHSQDYHPIVNLALRLISSIPFLAKREVLFLYATTTSEYYVDTVKKNVCKDVRLQQSTSEYLQHSAAAVDEVRLDISDRGFWEISQMVFLDVKVFNPNVNENI